MQCITSEEKRASCHVEADCLVDQVRGDAGTEHDVFALLKWRIGEMLHDAEISLDCFHEDVITAKMAELAQSDRK